MAGKVTYKRRPLTAEDIRQINSSLQFRTMKLKNHVVCDFCGEDDPKWVYAAVRTSTHVEVSNWRWTACDICERAITANDWRLLRMRVASALSALIRFGFTPEQVYRAVDASLQGFFDDAEEEKDGGG